MIGVVGAGAWGTALAQMLASDGREVLLWALEEGLADAINAQHRNELFLPSAELAGLAPFIVECFGVVEIEGHRYICLQARPTPPPPSALRLGALPSAV